MFYPMSELHYRSMSMVPDILVADFYLVALFVHACIWFACFLMTGGWMQDLLQPKTGAECPIVTATDTVAGNV